MDTQKKFIVVEAYKSDFYDKSFSKKINEALDKGYTFYGKPTFIDKRGHLYGVQMMVLYEK